MYIHELLGEYTCICTCTMIKCVSKFLITEILLLSCLPLKKKYGTKEERMADLL